MPISKKKASNAVDELLENGLITPDQSLNYITMNREGITYHRLMIEELGKVTGTLYLREETAQHKILNSLDFRPEYMSVPEVLLLEDSLFYEPWHNERYSEADAQTKFEAESGEPWHVSIQGKYTPLESVNQWFLHHPEYAVKTTQILEAAYGSLA